MVDNKDSIQTYQAYPVSQAQPLIDGKPMHGSSVIVAPTTPKNKKELPPELLALLTPIKK